MWFGAGRLTLSWAQPIQSMYNQNTNAKGGASKADLLFESYIFRLLLNASIQ